MDYQLNPATDFLTKYVAVIGITHYDTNGKPNSGDYCDCLHGCDEFWVLLADAHKIEDRVMLIGTLPATLEYG